MNKPYRVDHLSNGLTLVFDYGSKSYGCYNGDGSYRHSDLRAATLVELLKRLDNNERIRQREMHDPKGCRKRHRCAWLQRAWHRSRWLNAAACVPYVAPTSRRARPPLFRRQQREAADLVL